jgi:DNA-binding response OmpR family regulator
LKRNILFIGYEPPLREEIREFLKEREGEVFFSDTVDGTIRIMDSEDIETVILNMKRLEDAAILRYININYQEARVLIMPARQLQDVIPALAAGRYEIISEPFRLEELGKML